MTSVRIFWRNIRGAFGESHYQKSKDGSSNRNVTKGSLPSVHFECNMRGPIAWGQFHSVAPQAGLWIRAVFFLTAFSLDVLVVACQPRLCSSGKILAAPPRAATLHLQYLSSNTAERRFRANLLPAAHLSDAIPGGRPEAA